MENKTVRDGSQNVKKRKLLYKVHYFLFLCQMFFIRTTLRQRGYYSYGPVCLSVCH